MGWERWRVVAVLLLGMAIGAGIVWGLRPARGPRVEVIEGWTTSVNEAGTAIGLERGPEGADKGYDIAGAFWREAGGGWHTGGPTCLIPLTSGQRVRMAVVAVEPTLEAPGREVVVWLECLD